MFDHLVVPRQMRAAEQAEERRRAAEVAAVTQRAQEQARKAAAAEERRQKLEAEVQVRLNAAVTPHSWAHRASRGWFGITTSVIGALTSAETAVSTCSESVVLISGCAASLHADPCWFKGKFGSR